MRSEAPNTMVINYENLPCYDPYDLWMTPLGVDIRQKYYEGSLLGKLGAVAVGVTDWMIPETSRRLAQSEKRLYPITLAQWILCQDSVDAATTTRILDDLVTIAAEANPQQMSWGLGFPWMSKNGLYDTETPFVTHTPYVMKALLHLSEVGEGETDRALHYFDLTLPFLDSLKVMFESATELALSYAPIDEPRIVVNANSYAAYAYTLHLIRQKNHGMQTSHELKKRVTKIVEWVLNQQNDDGSWYYYADNDPGNFIDAFHSCFVLKNLQAVSHQAAELSSRIEPCLKRGMDFLQDNFLTSNGLLKRFTVRDITDPFSWDLYDQAEFLGLLIDTGEMEQANSFHQTVQEHFSRRGQLCSKIDFFGKKYGTGFLRWGVMPYMLQAVRLSRAQD